MMVNVQHYSTSSFGISWYINGTNTSKKELVNIYFPLQRKPNMYPYMSHVDVQTCVPTHEVYHYDFQIYTMACSCSVEVACRADLREQGPEF